MNVSELESLIEQGYIICQHHPDDEELMILNYTRKTQYDGKWNRVTKMARGLIVKGAGLEAAVVVARPWGKFFSLEQTESGWAAGDEEEGGGPAEPIEIDYSSPAEVTDKMDGSMLILYKDPGGLAALATRGSFSSGQARFYTRLLRSGSPGVLDGIDIENTTFIFEGIGPSNRIILRYDRDEIIFLGAVDKSTGKYISPTIYRDYFSSCGIKSVEVFPAKTLAEALALPPRENAEGIVVRYLESELQFKVKQEDYLELHRTVFNSDNIMIWEKAVEADCKLVDFSFLPEDLQGKAYSEYERVCGDYRRVETECLQGFEEIKNAMAARGEDFESRKHFAAYATKSAHSYMLFALYDGNGANFKKGVFRAIKPQERIPLFYVGDRC